VNDVVLLAAVDEEFKFRGVLTFISSGERVDGAIVGEPTDLRLVIAHKGCVRFTVTTLGRAGHSSRPETGSNAISAMARVVHALDELARQLATRPHAVVGPPTLSIGRIWGGTGVNTIPGRATIEVDRRLVPGETANGALEEVDAILDGLDVRSERDEPFLVTPPLDTPPDAPVVAAVAAACRASKLSSDPTGVPYGSDASKLWAYAGVPSVVLGPGSIDAAHSAAEHVRVDDLVAAARVYLGAALVPL
jgi:acetylornithine deacetylase/succinyl-diaminopimelate desuccinylase-like protein